MTSLLTMLCPTQAYVAVLSAYACFVNMACHLQATHCLKCPLPVQLCVSDTHPQACATCNVHSCQSSALRVPSAGGCCECTAASAALLAPFKVDLLNTSGRNTEDYTSCQQTNNPSADSCQEPPRPRPAYDPTKHNACNTDRP